ncbi:hypothetical protein IWW50_001301, partial [Coemansia erecta]
LVVASDAEDSQDEDYGVDDEEPTSIEKMIMSSTGVANWKLIRRLLQKHRDESEVVELLIQWMADEQAGADQWWAEDGPPDYEGPIQPTPAQNIVDPVPDTTNNIPETSPEPSESKLAVEEAVDDPKPVLDLEPKPELEPEPEPELKPKQKSKHVKGAARQRKAESKKRQKEMAKIKKRQAAREAVAETNTDTRIRAANNSSDIAQQMTHIYI